MHTDVRFKGTLVSKSMFYPRSGLAFLEQQPCKRDQSEKNLHCPSLENFRAEGHGKSLQMYIFRSYNTSTLNALRFDENSFQCQCEKEDKKA